MKKIIVIVTGRGILFLSVLICMQTNAQNIAQQLDSFFMASNNYESINGNVLVAENEKIVYQKSFGFANLEKKVLNTADASFNIASVTKTFTATAILQLKEKGKLQLNDPFVKYFPEFPFPAITIRNLLSHMSGLPDYEIFFDTVKKDPGRILTAADIIPCIKSFNKPLKYQPGSDWNYCNTNFELLALLVEKISKLSFSQYLKKYIFLPSGMTHTYVQTVNEKIPDSNRVVDYMPDKFYQVSFTSADSIHNQWLHIVLHNLSGIPGAGMIISTTHDLLNYDNALYSGKLLSNASLEEAFTPATLDNGKDYDAGVNPRLGKSHYGLGWEIYADTSMGRIVTHGGSYPGIVTTFLRNTSKKQTIILFDNNYWTGIFFMGKMVSQIINGQPVRNILPKKSLARVYGQSMMKYGEDTAFNTLITLRTDTVHYSISEKEFNTLGYQFLLDGYTAKAVEVFKTNILLSPQSFNVYDSYADALAKSGKKEDAIVMYKKSIELNPHYQEAKDKLKNLLKEN